MPHPNWAKEKDMRMGSELRPTSKKIYKAIVSSTLCATYSTFPIHPSKKLFHMYTEKQVKEKAFFITGNCLHRTMEKAFLSSFHVRCRNHYGQNNHHMKPVFMTYACNRSKNHHSYIFTMLLMSKGKATTRKRRVLL